jgi:hypothetical protein
VRLGRLERFSGRSNRIGHAKTDQTGAATHVDNPIIGVAAEALSAWLAASGVTEGAIFRRIARTACGSSGLAMQEPRMLRESAWADIRRQKCRIGSAMRNSAADRWSNVWPVLIQV